MPTRCCWAAKVVRRKRGAGYEQRPMTTVFAGMPVVNFEFHAALTTVMVAPGTYVTKPPLPSLTQKPALASEAQPAGRWCRRRRS